MQKGRRKVDLNFVELCGAREDWIERHYRLGVCGAGQALSRSKQTAISCLIGIAAVAIPRISDALAAEN